MPETVGERIRQLREMRDLRAVDLARQAGISRSYLSEIEAGLKDGPSAEIMYDIATVLGTTIPNLLGRPEQPRGRQSHDHD